MLPFEDLIVRLGIIVYRHWNHVECGAPNTSFEMPTILALIRLLFFYIN